MLKDYKEQFASPPTEKQAMEMLRILSYTVLEALKQLPEIPENQQVRALLDAGAVAAVYQKVRDYIPEKAFMEEIMGLYMVKEEKKEDAAPRE